MFWYDAIHPATGQRLEVHAAYQPLRRGLRDRFGVPLEPDDPEEVEICRVWDEQGGEVPFAEFERELEEEGLRWVQEGEA